MKQTSSKYMIIIFAVVLVALLVLMAVLNKSQNSSALEDLPNYTEIRGEMNLDQIDYSRQPHLGSGTTGIQVIEFADFKCPACMMWDGAYFEKLKEEFVDTDKIDLYFMNFAFIDRDSILAAAAGESIYQQNNDAFWQYKSLLFENQGIEKDIWATEKFLLQFVKDNITGIDYDQFKSDLKNHTHALDVKEDFKLAGSLGVNGTPKFMVNGRLLPSSSYEDLVAAIEAEIARVK
ncbi:DsbA family protein [Paenibacillus sp. FA6]|uniref:DsbA family protein n=1 Tax=Paenibacillus sp. FA6 TaxID=3413029 RepID=UPI003F65AB1F